MTIQEVILKLDPKFKFENHIRFLQGQSLEEALFPVLIQMRKKMFLSGDWDREKEALCKSVFKKEEDIKYYQAYNVINKLVFPNNFPLFTTFFREMEKKT